MTCAIKQLTCCTDPEVYAVVPLCPVPEVNAGENQTIPDGGALQPFDFAVLRFSWGPDDGADLDIRTWLTDLDPAYNDQIVGWCNLVEVGPDPYYLVWGGDNVESAGIEAVLVNFPNMTTDFPSALSITIRTYCNWYSSRALGNFLVQFETYLGGSMEQDGFNFINVGGVLVEQINKEYNVESLASACINGDFVCDLVYNTVTKTAFISP